MIRTFYVYALKCPDTGDVRYIGKTCDPERRFRWHMYQKTKDHKGFWIQKLRRNKKKPVIQVLASGLTFDQANNLEIFLIALLRLMGTNLVNSTNGGEGCSGFKQSEETKQRLREINRGNNHGAHVRHDEKFKAELAQRNRERVWTAEQRKKSSRSHSGRKLTEEHRRKLAEHWREYWKQPNEDHRRKLAHLASKLSSL
jgi:hypothetical protein